MMKSLYTAASGMIAQQIGVDTISNNLANVNTVGYKTESTEFKSLLYQNMQSKTTSANGEYKPVSAQVGLGTRVSSITSHFTQGPLNATDSKTDFAINGDGLFGVIDENGEVLYTRAGNFKFSTAAEGSMLCTNDGYPIASADGTPIILSDEYNISKVTVDTDGNLFYKDENAEVVPMGIKIGLFQFANPSGLEKIGGNLLKQTDASGLPLNEDYDDVGKKSILRQSYLEGSNVQIASEMVNLITAQRAYELCSKAITTSDTMMEQANNLKR